MVTTKEKKMNNFLLVFGAFAFCLLAWLVIYDGISRHAVIYQECGGQYCAPMDPPLRNK